MTWTKLSDDFADDCDQLSSDAFRLHVEGLIWSNRKLLDLQIDKTRMARWVWNPDLADIAVKELLAAGWWSDEGHHYVIRHHGCYQRTREQVLKQQEVNRANRAKGRARPVREQAGDHRPETRPSDESSDEPSDERDWPGSGQDRPLREATKNEVLCCRYCGAEVPEQQRAQRVRGYCRRPRCEAAAVEELAG